MRYYKWKKYREEILKPVTSKCYNHELYIEVTSLISEIDRNYRILYYIKSVNKKQKGTELSKKFSGTLHSYGYSRRDLDKRWVEHEIKSKIAYLNDMMLVMRLGS